MFHYSLERWVGEGTPKSSIGKWSSGFEAVAVKKMQRTVQTLAERDALSQVQQKLKGRAGPFHITQLGEAVDVKTADGPDQIALVTK